MQRSSKIASSVDSGVSSWEDSMRSKDPAISVDSMSSLDFAISV